MPSQMLQLGIFVMILAGLFNTGLLVFADVLKGMRWPCYRVFSMSCMLISPCIALALRIFGTEWPSPKMIFWLLLRPLFACGSFVCCIVAVQMSTPFGDVASLGSINIVTAAFLGRLFLKEDVQVVHGIALILSTFGAVLISRPEIIFGGTGNDRGSWFGYVLAIASGLLDALSFVCSRKSIDVPAGFIMLGTCIVSILVLFVMGSIPQFEDHSLSVLVTSPWKASLIVGIGCALTVLCTAACVIGSVLCPAAVSTTVYTSVNLASGYIAQLLIHNSRPSPLTVTGAVLMMLAVAIMVLARKRVELIQDTRDDQGGAAEEDNNHDGNIASFIAVEFATIAPEASIPQKRRGVQATTKAQVTTIIGI